MRKIVFLLLIGTSVADGMSSLEQFLQAKNNTISANFTQTAFGHKKNQISTGVMKISRPNRFKWKYDDQGSNIGQLMVSDGKNVYIVDKELEQVTVKKLGSTLDKSPATILAGNNDIKKYYNIANQKDSYGMEWVLLMPKSQNDNNGFQSVSMGFNKNTLVLQQMKFISNLGGRVQLDFTNLKTGIKYKSDEFTYKIPKGYDVIDDNVN